MGRSKTATTRCAACNTEATIAVTGLHGKLLWECSASIGTEEEPETCGARNILEIDDGPSHAAVDADHALAEFSTAAAPEGAEAVSSGDEGGAADQHG